MVHASLFIRRHRSKAGVRKSEARSNRLIQAAARHGAAIELSDRFRVPYADFVKRAETAGCEFFLGTGNTGSA